MFEPTVLTAVRLQKILFIEESKVSSEAGAH
jgi:hypothetical protein